MVCAALLVPVLLAVYFRKNSLIDRLHGSIMALLLFSPVVHPWYIAWIAVLLPISRRWSAIAYCAAASLTSFTVLHYQLQGTWEQSPLLLLLEYSPVLVLFALEFFRPNHPAVPGSSTSSIHSR
jgi:hypothetical protein